jgi:hypothetical protein
MTVTGLIKNIAHTYFNTESTVVLISFTLKLRDMQVQLITKQIVPESFHPKFSHALLVVNLLNVAAKIQLLQNRKFKLCDPICISLHFGQIVYSTT